MCCFAEMKTGKYTTTKKSKTKQPSNQLPPRLAQVADLAAEYINAWTKKELNRLQQNTKPICVQITDGYLVGKFTVKKLPTEQWRVIDSGGVLVNDFYHKMGAILYCIQYSSNKLIAARELLLLDREFTKHDSDIRVYRHNISRALATKDYFTYDKLVARLDLSVKKKAVAEDNLKKTFNRAKYYKIWE